MKLLQPKELNPGDQSVLEAEERVESIRFNIHKFTPRRRPDRANVAIFPHFAEFGSELVESIYCLPILLNSKYQGKYSIVMGWAGRAYLYKHLVDEFWEIKPEHQHLREYCRAFHHTSKNLKLAEKNASEFGNVINTPQEYSHLCLTPRLNCCSDETCKQPLLYTDSGQICIRCRKHHNRVGFYNEVQTAKRTLAVWPKTPSAEKLAYVDRYLKPNSVGVTARFRTCYGRNLPKEFYESLILRLESMGYNPIWIGEKETTLRSPFERITDFAASEDARDLETTLALVSKLKFTIQYWTASTRLAGLVGTPYVLFESPDQIWGVGQEGIRLNLCTKGKGKLVLAHYVNVRDDHKQAIDLSEKAIREVLESNYEPLIGMVESDTVIADLREKNEYRVGSR